MYHWRIFYINYLIRIIWAIRIRSRTQNQNKGRHYLCRLYFKINILGKLEILKKLQFMHMLKDVTQTLLMVTDQVNKNLQRGNSCWRCLCRWQIYIGIHFKMNTRPRTFLISFPLPSWPAVRSYWPHLRRFLVAQPSSDGLLAEVYQ